MNSLQQHVCSHCGISFRWSPLEAASEDGSPLVFCCRGCQGAYRLICGAGLGEFYQRSERSVPTVHEEEVSPYRNEDLTSYLLPDGDYCRLDILVGGISCPACIWLLERMIARLDGISDVSVSYAGGIASIRFDPAVATVTEIFATISGLGFTPRPYSPALSEQELRREREGLLIRLGTALFLTMQLMAYSYGLYAGYFQGMGAAIKSVLEYASLFVATPVVFYCGWPFLSSALQSLRSRSPGMDLLIAVGALTAWLYSAWAVWAGRETYFDSAAMIVTFVLVGRLLELSVRRNALSGIESLYAAVPQLATRLDGVVSSEIPVDAVRPGDLLLVRQGEYFPVDGLLVDGETEVDQSFVTGESVPVLLQMGDEVRAGCVNSAAPVTIQALRPAGQSYLMRVAALVRMAQGKKPSLQRLADRVSGWFVPAVILLAVIVFTVHLLFFAQGAGAAIMVSLSVVLIACPCAMGLAVPAAVLAACSRSASLGILLRGGDVIERLAAIDTAFFDKTGTLTAGRPRVVSFLPAESYPPAAVLQAAASLEHAAAHPLARSIVEFAAENGILPEACSGFSVQPGKGVSGVLMDGRRVLCGSRLFLEEQGIMLPNGAEEGDGRNTCVLLAVAGHYAGCFYLTDRVRPGTHRLVSAFLAQGITMSLISGDTQQVVDRIASETGIPATMGGLTPDRKLEMIRQAQQSGKQVLMAGDGVNDAPALAAADVSCSLSGSSDIALENADIIITADDLSLLATAHHISRRTMIVIRQNLIWAFLYNIIGIPLAVFGLLTPLYAAVAMTASSILVSLNSLRLMRIKHHG